MKVEECRNCKACQPTQLAYEAKGFGSTISSGSPSQPTFCATSTPSFGPLNICISNNCSGLEIKFEQLGGTLFNLNFPLASAASGTTSTCRATVPSPFGVTPSGATNVCRTAVPSPSGMAPCGASATAFPFENLPTGLNTTSGTTYQSQFGSAPFQTITPCGMTCPAGTTVTFIVGSTPCTTCSTSPFNLHSHRVGSYTESPPKVSLPHFKEEPQAQCTGTKMVAYSPTVVLDGSHLIYAVHLQSISGMPAYNNKSIEELRWEDYRLGHEGELKSRSKPREEGPCTASPTKLSTFSPPTSSTLKFPSSPGFGFHAFTTSSDHTTSSAFHASSNIFNKTTPPSKFRSSFTSGFNSNVPLFGAPNTTASSCCNSSASGSVPPPTSMKSAPPHHHPFSNSKATTVFGKPQVSGTAAPCIFGIPPVSTFGTSCSTPHPFFNSTTTSVFGKTQTSGNVDLCVFGSPPAPAFGNCSTASPNSVPACSICSSVSTAKSEASFSASSTSALSKNQLSGSGTSSTPSLSSEPSIRLTPPAFGQLSPFGSTSANLFTLSSTPSFSSEPSIRWTPPAFGQLSPLGNTSANPFTSSSSSSFSSEPSIGWTQSVFGQSSPFGNTSANLFASSSAPSFSSEPSIRWTPPAFGQSSPFGNTSANLFAKPFSSPNVQPSINPFSKSVGDTSTSPSIGSEENLFASNYNVINPMGSGQPTLSSPTESQAKPATPDAYGTSDLSDALSRVTLEQQHEEMKASAEHENE